MKLKIFGWLPVIIFITNINLSAQYFGRNKPVYKVFNYKVYSSPNFEIYHYLGNDSLLEDFTLRGEQWYRLHQHFLGDTLMFKNPVVLYESHVDFQQTNVTSGSIGIGTGGFTEGLKNRVVLPLSLTNAQTDHVLGHELVHAFQYNYLLNTHQLSLRDLSNIPLWMIEGMAEYLSVGSVDPITAMWLRDDLLNNTLPTIYKISTDSKYNPYRYGQAFWAFTDHSVKSNQFGPLLSSTAKLGLEKAFEKTLTKSVELRPPGKKEFFKRFKKKSVADIIALGYENFDSIWQESIKSHYGPFLKGHEEKITGEILFNDKNAGNYNFSPVISPDGTRVIFMSEKELFSIDMFLADTETGKIKKRFSKIVNENEVDAFNFVESSGTWSPDGKYFAYVVYEKGENVLLIVDMKKGKVVKGIKAEGISEMSFPSWGPNNKIALSAMKNGITDIYTLDIDNLKLERITTDGESNIQPDWSSDGRSLVYITEKNSGTSGNIQFEKNIARYDFATGKSTPLDVFKGANNLNPQFSPDNNSIYFLSDRDGFRNLYRFDLLKNEVFQCTAYFTGIAGMTMLSPAMNISQNGKIVYTYYSNHKYEIIKADLSEFEDIEFLVDKNAIDFTAAKLPSLGSTNSEVDKNLDTRPRIIANGNKKFTELKYRPKFQLDYVSEVSAGVSTGFMRPGATGGTTAIFSDIVGNNQLILNLNINGTIYDFGGIAAYVNKKHRLNYGISLSHIPYYMGNRWAVYDTLVNVDGEEHESDMIIFEQYRIFESQLMFSSYYPLSSTMRFEGAVSATRYGYKFHRYNNYYDSTSNRPFAANVKEIDAPNPEFYLQTDMAFVLDNSKFGLTSPLRGTRGRIQVSKNYGYYNHYTTLFDFRKYYFKQPVGIAFRILNYNRIGTTADKNIYNSLYLGYPWYIRGYNGLSLNRESRSLTEALTIDNLRGSKMIVSNFEFRIPFTGPKKLCLINSRVLFTDLVLFADAGVVWDNRSRVKLKWETGNANERIPLVSTGISTRFNILGYLILEPYYAFPFQLYDKLKGEFGLNIVPGW